MTDTVVARLSVPPRPPRDPACADDVEGKVRPGQDFLREGRQAHADACDARRGHRVVRRLGRPPGAHWPLCLVPPPRGIASMPLVPPATLPAREHVHESGP